MNDFYSQLEEYENLLLSASLYDEQIAKEIVTKLETDDFCFPWSQQFYETLAQLIHKEKQPTKENILLEVDCLEKYRGFESFFMKRRMERMTSSITFNEAMRLIDCIKDVSNQRHRKIVLYDYRVTADEDQCSYDDLMSKDFKSDGKTMNMSLVACSWAQNLLHDRDCRVNTGFPRLDSLLDGGLSRGDLVVLSSASSMGKSTLAMNILQHIALIKGKKSLFFTLEMSPSAFVARYVSRRFNLSRNEFKNKEVLSQVLADLAGEDGEYLTPNEVPLEFISNRYCIDEIERVAREVVSEQNNASVNKEQKDLLSLIVVDSLQCVNLPQNERTANKYDVEDQITMRLKRLAMELNVPVLLVSQTSDAIENHADVVAYLQNDPKKATTANEDERAMELVVGKNRNGPTDSIKLFFNAPRFSFREESSVKSANL